VKNIILLITDTFRYDNLRGNGASEAFLALWGESGGDGQGRWAIDYPEKDM